MYLIFFDYKCYNKKNAYFDFFKMYVDINFFRIQ